jgi:hypothetical protein
MRGHCLSSYQSGQMFIRQLGKGVEVTHLGLDILRSTIEPESPTSAPVKAQRSTYGIAIPARLQVALLREDLDSFPLPALLDRNA